MEEVQNDNQAPQSQKQDSAFMSALKFAWDFAKVIIVALVIILPIRYFVFQPFIVSGESMEPNFSNKQYLIIDEISYRFSEPQRGEVVVMRYPKDPKQFFIKRIIGLPGEKIQIDNGRVKIYNDQRPNGFVLDEPYLQSQGITFEHQNTLVGGKKLLELKRDEYFMMGDNRLASSDSRDWGPLERSEILGRVFIRVLPLKKTDVFSVPAYSYN